MTEFVSLASSSKGNCTLLKHNGRNILIDAGISTRRIFDSLQDFDVKLNDLHAIFLTHEHRDHMAALPVLLKKLDIPVYTSHGTHRAMCHTLKEDQPYVLYNAGDTFSLCDLQIKTFKTPHDTEESNGFLFDTGREKIAYLTDFGYLSEANLALISGAKTVLIESNYDRNMLFCGSYPHSLKERISGLCGHQDNRDCGDALVMLVQKGAEQVMLMHLSRDNNRPGIAKKTVSDTLLEFDIIPERDLCLAVAPYDDPLAIMV